MKKVLSIINYLAFLLTISGGLIAQNQEIISLDTDDSNISDTYVARDLVKYLPNYHFSAVSNGQMIGRIDEALVCEADYQLPGSIVDADNRTLDFSLDVGYTSGNPAVNSLGGATYTVPVFTPQGSNDMSPSVALFYNSQSGVDVAGLGWGISGMSSIIRTGSSIYYDGEISDVQFTSEDNFLLDGNRLIQIEGNGSYIVFAKEVEDFTRIRYYVNEDKFVLITKGGVTIEYGNTSDSRLILSGTSAPFVYSINKVYDRNGNYMEYKYSIDDSEIVIKEINYTGNVNAGVLPYNSIKFYYSEREDKNTAYIKGHPLNSNRILRMIKVFSNGSLVRTYSLEHYFDLYSKLNSIQEIGIGGVRLNKTIVNYGDDGELDVQQPLSFNYSAVKKIITGDFNFDGSTDIISVNASDFYGLSKLSGYDFYDVLNESVTTNGGSFGGLCYIEGTVNKSTLNNAPNFFVSNFNGDNVEDILLMDLEESYSHSYPQGGSLPDIDVDLLELSKLKIYEGGETGFNTYDLLISGDYNHIDPEKQFVIQGDFDGNGFCDVINVLFKPIYVQGIVPYGEFSHASNYKVMLSFPEDGVVHEVTGIDPVAFVNAEEIPVIDFNGDGKLDVMLIKDDGYDVYELTGTEPNYSFNLLYSSTLLNSDNEFLFGDFNGDKKVDFYVHGEYSPSEFGYYKSTGLGVEFSPFYPTEGVSTYKHFKVGDFNGDGLADLLYYFGNSTIDIYYSNGNDFVKKRYAYNVSGTFTLEVGDYNSDGSQDLMLLAQNANDNKILYFNRIGADFNNGDANNGKARSLYVTKILDGFNNWVSFGYEPLTKNSTSLYPAQSSLSSSDLGNNTFAYKIPMMIVEKMRMYNGTQNETGEGYNQTYFYYDDIILHINKGIIGFRRSAKLTTPNLSESMFQYSWMEFDQQNLLLLPYISGVNKASGNTEVSISQSDYQVVPLLNNRVLLKPQLVQVFDRLKHTIVKHHYDDVDQYGNVKEMVVEYVNNALNNYHVDRLDTIKTVYNSCGLEFPYLPTSVYTSKQVGNDAVYSITNTYTYDNQNGNLLSYTDNGVTTVYSNFNNFGNAEKITISANGEADRLSYVDYDETGRFVISSQNSLGYTEEFEYNDIGLLKKSTDIHGNSTTYKYDGWNRCIKKIYPIGVVEEKNYDWVSSPLEENVNVRYSSLSEITGEPYVKKYFDSFGNPLRVETENYGTVICNDVRYDKYGRLIKETDNYEAGSYNSAEAKVSTYDDYGRIATSNYNDISTEYEYYISGQNYAMKTKLLAPLNREYVVSYNSIGDVIKSEAPVGNVTTTMGNHGPVSTDAMNAVTSIGYNDRGLQESLNDPNSGLMTYEYNGFGELNKQTDANQNVIEIELDNHGRTDYTTTPEGQVNVEYVTSGNGKGEIDYIESPNGNKIQNYYDEYSRIEKTVETISGSTYEFEYEYNSTGKLEKETYPGDFAIKYVYDEETGELLGIKNAGDDTFIWYCDDYNIDGQPVDVFLGADASSLNTHYIYDSETKMISRIQTGSYFDMTYYWDDVTGNLEGRQDNIHQLREAFQYDDVDRLTEWEVENGYGDVVTYNTSYSSNGNISFKSDVGNYYYDQTKKHAITKITQPTTAISDVSQNIQYNYFHKATEISEDPYDLTFEYGPDNLRKETVLTENENPVEKRIFCGKYEVQILNEGTPQESIIEYNYISGPSGLIAVYIVEDGVGELYYTVSDYLGSILQIIDQNGNLIEETNFDPWGRYRNPQTWEYDDNANLTKVFRGFTGHEMLPHFALVHMNGRMYDPVLGRMLSPDNFVQDPNNPQNYNRYAYCYNNPLRFTDPSGEFIHIIVGAVIGGAINVVSKAIQGDLHSFSDGLAAFAIGAVAGGVGAATGGMAFLAAGGGALGVGGFMAGAMGGMAGAAFASPIQSIGNHLYFGDPLMTANQYANSVMMGGALGGVMNGSLAKINNRTFWNGNIKPAKIDTYIKIPYPDIETNKPEVNLKSPDLPKFKELPPSRGTIKEFNVRNLYLKEIENPHVYSSKHIQGGIEDALSSVKVEGFDEVAKAVMQVDRAGYLVQGSNQIRYVQNGYNIEVRLFIDKMGRVQSLDAFVLTSGGNPPRDINNVVNW